MFNPQPMLDWAWWYTPVILAFGTWRQEDQKFLVILRLARDDFELLTFLPLTPPLQRPLRPGAWRKGHLSMRPH